VDWEFAKLQLRNILASASHFSGLNSWLSSSTGSMIPWRILTYHRITSPEHESFPLEAGMYVRPETFSLHMKYLKDHAHVVPLEELVESISSHLQIAPRTVAITFDDGWRDNYLQAFPVLHELELPATIFLATDFVGTNELFWTDRLAQSAFALARAERFRTQILRRISEQDVLAPLFGTLDAALNLGNLDELRLDNVIRTVKERPAEIRRQMVNGLYTIAKEFGNIRNDRLFMDWNEVSEMAQAGVAFGSHSHRHNPMSELNDEQLSDDLLESYQCFREHNVSAVSTFCYPGGYHNERSQAALRAYGAPSALLAGRESRIQSEPPLFGRIHLHDDISSNIPLFTSFVWGPRVFAG